MARICAQPIRSVFLLVLAALAAGSLQAADLKVGFVYVGPVGDHGWTYQHHQGAKAIQEEYGDRVSLTTVENVSEGPAAERVIRQLASSGHGLILTTSFGFMDPTLKVAKRFPDVRFEHATGFKRWDNLATYAARFYEGRTILGHIAAHMTESDTVGYIGALPIPEVIRGINAFTIQLQRENPDAEVRVVWVNDWYDPGKEADAANALIDAGADVIVQHTDSPAALQVAQERDVYAFGQASDMYRFAPDAQLTAIIDDWAPYYIERAGMALEGEWIATDTWGGLASGMVKMADYTNMPDELAAEAEALEQAIVEGEVHPFEGPIRAQDGELLKAEGAQYSDAELLSMDFYVQGVQGKVPN